MIKYTKEVLNGKRPILSRRSSKWPELRKRILEKQPFCSCCGRTVNLEVHHIIPFHVDRTKELDESNLIVLCDDTEFNCHLKIGHNGNFKNFNANVLADIIQNSCCIKTKADAGLIAFKEQLRLGEKAIVVSASVDNVFKFYLWDAESNVFNPLDNQSLLKLMGKLSGNDHIWVELDDIGMDFIEPAMSVYEFVLVPNISRRIAIEMFTNKFGFQVIQL